MSNDDDLEEYECQAAGHTGSRSFYEPAGWSPKWCPDECRPWKNAQVDQEYTCQSCGVRFCITAQTKIYHYFNEGPWEDPTDCPRCVRYGPPPKNTGQRPKPKKALKKQNAFSKLQSFRDPTPHPIATNPDDYQRWKPYEGLTCQQHIEQHTAWSQFSRTSEPDPNDCKSPTALDDDVSTFEGLLQAVNEITQITVEDSVREYTNSGNNNVVHLTLLDSNRIEATIMKPNAGPNGHELVTTYDSVTFTEIRRNIRTGKWQ